jgi:hypothetical protein
MNDKNGDSYLIKLSLIALVILIAGLPGLIRTAYSNWESKNKAEKVAVENIKDKKTSYSSYDEGYSDGYRDGLYDADSDCDHDVNEIVSVIYEAADSFAYSYTDLGVYDAWDIITVYLDGHDPSGNPLPTKKEFEQAVDTLLFFSMFFEMNYGDYDSIMRDYDPFYG